MEIPVIANELQFITAFPPTKVEILAHWGNLYMNGKAYLIFM